MSSPYQGVFVTCPSFRNVIDWTLKVKVEILQFHHWYNPEVQSESAHEYSSQWPFFWVFSLTLSRVQWLRFDGDQKITWKKLAQIFTPFAMDIINFLRLGPFPLLSIFQKAPATSFILVVDTRCEVPFVDGKKLIDLSVVAKTLTCLQKKHFRKCGKDTFGMLSPFSFI